jgi:DNA-binding LacI/PurR family transcriptional regulator
MDETYERLNGGRSDGLIFFGPAHAHPLLRLLRGSRLSTVLLNHVDEEGVLSSVSEDMEDGMHRVAETLLGLGHRRIAAIGGGPWSDALPRIAALRASLSSRAVLPDRHVLAVYDDGPLRPEEALARLMDDTEPPTALFCWHDRVGYRMLEACERLGIQVPDQLSLIGYDGLHWPSTSQHVLASVEVALDTLAEAAVRLLDELIQGRQDPPERRVYPVSLSRGTTLAPREYP